MDTGSVIHQLWFGLTVTLVAYIGAKWVHKRIPWLHPILTSSGVLMALLLIGDIPLETYKEGADLWSVILGPATVALGVPIYKNREHIKQQFKAIILSITCGAVVGVVSVAGILSLFDNGGELLQSMLPKSVTSPIAIEIANTIGGVPELAAVFSVITGFVGALAGNAFLRKVGIRDELSQGIAMGTAAHGFGTAKCLSESDKQGMFSGLAMGLMGVMTSVLFAFLQFIF